MKIMLINYTLLATTSTIFFSIFLLPNLQAQEIEELELRSDAIVLPRTIGCLVDNPVKGMVIYNAETNTLYTFDGTSWEEVGGGFIRDGNIIRQKNSEFTNVFLFGVDELPEDDNSNPNLRGDKTENSKQSSTGKFFFFDERQGAFRGGELENSYAWGPSKLGEASFGYGKNVLASGQYSTALGWNTQAIGFSSLALGEENKAVGFNAIALGRSSEALGSGSISIGEATIAHAQHGLAIGEYNDTLVAKGYNGSDKPLLIIGNGTSDLARSNAMVVRQNGLLTIQKDLVVGAHELPGADPIIDSLFFYDKSKAAAVGGYVNTAYGPGWAPNNIGTGSFSFGINSRASGKGSISLGVRNAAYGMDGATALGYFSEANANSGTVVGQFNDPLVSIGYSALDKPLFIVGNGISSGSRSNALVVRQTGEVAFSNYTFPIDDGSTGQILKTNGSGQLSWTNANSTFQCPTGYNEVSDFCIEEAVNSVGQKNLGESIETCAISGGKLPSYQQFHLAISQHAFSGSLNNHNWVADLLYTTSVRGTVVKANDSSDVIASTISTNRDFRCVIEK